MDGSAIYLGLSAVFVSNLIGLSLSFDEYLLILVTATIRVLMLQNANQLL